MPRALLARLRLNVLSHVWRTVPNQKCPRRYMSALITVYWLIGYLCRVFHPWASTHNLHPLGKEGLQWNRCRDRIRRVDGRRLVSFCYRLDKWAFAVDKWVLILISLLAMLRLSSSVPSDTPDPLIRRYLYCNFLRWHFHTLISLSAWSIIILLLMFV